MDKKIFLENLMEYIKENMNEENRACDQIFADEIARSQRLLIGRSSHQCAETLAVYVDLKLDLAHQNIIHGAFLRAFKFGDLGYTFLEIW